MWIEKLTDGIIQLDTAIGPRYVQPNLLQRAYLLWTFRNFFSLPQQVLRPRERRLIDRLWSENRFVSLSIAGASDRPVIGRVERRTRVQRKARRARPGSRLRLGPNESAKQNSNRLNLRKRVLLLLPASTCSDCPHAAGSRPVLPRSGAHNFSRFPPP